MCENHEFDDDYCSNMFKITCWMFEYVCKLMGHELLVLVVKFDLNCEVLECLVKNEYDGENSMI